MAATGEQVEATGKLAMAAMVRRERRIAPLIAARRNGSPMNPTTAALVDEVLLLRDTVEALTLGDSSTDPDEVRDLLVGAAVVSVLGAVVAGALVGAGRVTYRRWRA